MSLSGAAAALGLPETLVQRSAEARAAETGQSVEEILAAWAGGEAIPSASSEPSSEDVAEAQPEAEKEPPAITAEDPALEIEIPRPAATSVPAAPTRAPLPKEVTLGETAHFHEVITVPTAGIKERTNFVIPKWLTALLIIAPLIALFALGGSATGTCGEGTELDTDVISGDIVNCDGSEFTGSGAGGGGANFVALGDAIYNGELVTGVNCASCHAPSGQGTGSFPALTGVMTTFGACGDHIEWVTLGTGGFQGVGRETYGDTGKMVGGAGTMPGFGGSLTEEQIAAVAAFERVRFGGADPEATLVDCGLVEPEADETSPTEGEEMVTSSTVAPDG